MAMTNEQLMIELGLDATKVTKSISQLKTDLKSLEKQRALSKTEADLDVVNRKIKLVEGQITRLKNIGFDNLEKSSKGARTAVTNLSVAIQDLPFGFIGVQNNLPGVIQGFGNLASESKGVSGFFKNLLGQLKGPAGLFLAFSAVTSIVTVLSQKYGGLGEAIDALFGKTNKFLNEFKNAQKAFEEFAKSQRSTEQITNDAIASQSGQIATIQILTKKATDLTSTTEEQNLAFQQLKATTDGYHDGLTIGTKNVDAIRAATERYIKVLIAKSKIEAFQREISDIDKLVRENDRLQKVAEKNVETARRQDEYNKKVIESSAKLGGAATKLKSGLGDAEGKLTTLAETSFTLRNQIKELDDQIVQTAGDLVKYSNITDDATKSVKKYFEAYKPPQEYLDFIRSFDDISKFQRGQDLFSDLGNIDFTKGANSVTKFNEVIKTLQQDFPNLFEGFGVSSAAEIPKQFTEVRAILKNALDNLAGYIVQEGQSGKINKAAGTLADAYFGSTEQIRNGLKKAREAAKKALNEYQPLDTSNVFGKGPGTYEQVFAPLIKMQEDARKATLKFVQDTRDAANLLNGVFFQPLQDQFKNLFDTGKFSFREFGKAIVENMKQVVAKLIATGIIALLATIATTALNPGAAAATKLTGFQIFSRAFAGQLGFGPQRGPNLANIGAGGLAMSGAVNLTLRGSDLVGALNRTNTNINRIG